MASTKILATSRAASASTVRLMPMTPPKAETGSHSRALRQASASEGCSAQPHGLVCLMMATAGESNSAASHEDLGHFAPGCGTHGVGAAEDASEGRYGVPLEGFAPGFGDRGRFGEAWRKALE